MAAAALITSSGPSSPCRDDVSYVDPFATTRLPEWTEPSFISGAGLLQRIRLYKEDEDVTPVFNTCDEMRRKITKHIEDTKITLHLLGLLLHCQLHGPRDIKSITGSQISAFRKKRGSRAGNTTVVFYAAFVYFEKLRILKGEKESEHRQTMEEIWPVGFDVKTPPHNIHYIGSAAYHDGEFEYDEFAEPDFGYRF